MKTKIIYPTKLAPPLKLLAARSQRRWTLLLSGIFLSAISFSQTPDWLWAKGMFGAGAKTGQGIAVDASGNVYTTGMFTGTVDFDPGPGTFNLTSSGLDDIFVSKFDGTGNFVWAIFFSGGYDDRSYSIALDASGNIFSTGTFRGMVDFDPGPGTFVLTATGLTYGDIYVSKLDNAGNFIWAKSMVGATSIEDVGYSVAADASGNVYTTGYFYGTVDFDPSVAGTFNLTSAGSADAFISKLDALGNFTWAKQLGGTSYDKAHSVKVDASGNVYTTGSFIGSADFDPGAATFIFNATSANDVFISKLNASGNFVWAKQISGNSDQIANSLVIAGSGDVCITGAFYGLTDFDPGAGTYNLSPSGSADIFILRLDASANFIWAKKMGGTTSDIGYSIDADASGNLYTTGTFTGTSDFDPGAGAYNLTSAGGYDLFVCKSDGSGNFVWAKKIGGTDYEYVNSIAVSASGNLNITGSFHSPTISLGTTTLIYGSTIYDDIFIAKLDNPVSPPLALITAGGPTSICAPATVTLNANTGTGLTYQWRKDNVNIAGANSSSYVTGSTGNYECLVTNATGSSISNVIAVYSSTVPPVATITAGGPTTFCTGGNVTLSANSGGEFSYQWQLNGVDISGATASTRTVTAAGSYNCVVSNGCGSSASNIILVTINSGPPITISATGPVIFCAPGSVTLNANPSSGITWQWRLNSVNISGATLSTYVATATGIYTCVGNNGCSSTSNSITVTALTGPPSAAISAGGPTTFCAPGTVTLSALTGTGQTYQWRLNGVNISGATNSTRVVSASGSYVCIVTNACASSTSNTIAVTVNPLPPASITAGGPTSFCSPGSVLLSANTGSGLTWQWRLNSFNILSAVSSTYLANADGNYDCIVTNICGSAASNSITVIVSTAPPVASISAIGSTTFCLPGSVELLANTGAGFTYQWRLNNVNISGATAATYTATAAGNFNCVVSNPCGSTTSNTITVEILPCVSPNSLRFDGADDIVTAYSPGITFGNGDITIEAWINNARSAATPANEVIFRASDGTNTAISLFLIDGQVGTAIYGTPAYQFQNPFGPDLRDNMCHHVAVVRAGNSISAYVDGAWIVTENDNVSYLTTTPWQDIGGASFNYTLEPFMGLIKEVRVWNVARTQTEIQNNMNVVLNGAANSGLVNYWRLNEGSGQVINNYSQYTSSSAFIGSTNAADVNDPFWSNGCPSCAPPVATITAGGPIIFCEPGNVVLSVSTCASCTYQWRLNGGNISGATGTTHTVSNFFNSGNYDCVVTNSCGNVTSNLISVIVNPLPFVLVTPMNSTICNTGSVSLFTTFSSGYSYQWYWNSNIIPGATSNFYTTSAAGIYTCVVTNPCGSVTSNPATVTVYFSPTASITANGPTAICPTCSVTLNVNTGAGLSYQWRLNSVNISAATAPSYVASAAGAYTCEVTNVCGSVISNVITVQILQPISANALHFDGVNGYVSVSNYYNSIGTGNFTIEAWIRDDAPIVSGSAEPIIDNRDNSPGPNLGFRVEIADGHLTFFAGLYGNSCGGADLRDNTCHHIAITRNSSNPGDNIRFYIDGQFAGSTYNVSSLNSDAPAIYIGAKQNLFGPGVWAFNGLVKEVRIWNVERTQNQLQSHMGYALIGNAYPNLVGYWKCSEGSGGTAYDYSVNANNGILTATNFVAPTWDVGCSGCALPPAAITASGSTSLCSPATVTLNANTGSGITYQWRLNGVPISNATLSSFVASAAGNYDCVETNTCGSIASNVIAVTVSTSPIASITAAGPVIFCDPGSVTLNAFTAAGYSWQWRLNGVNINGATSASYIAASSGNYDCIETNSCGSATSNSIAVTAELLPSASATAGGPTTFCTPGSVVLSVSTCSNCTYQWRMNAGNISGANSSSYTATSTGSYDCVVTNTCGSRTSNNITVTTAGALPAANITASGPTTFCSPGSVTLNANTGTGISYQWRLNGGNISGATSSSYVVTASGNFDCVVSNSCGSVTSNLISTTITAPPTASITAGGPTTFCSPGSVTLNANTGSGLNYQWRLYGGNISGATASSYIATAGGSYNCIVSNTCGSATSNSITVTVGIYPPASVTAAGSPTFCSPGSVLLNANTGAGLTYQWRVNGGNISGATSTFYYATASGIFDCVVSSSCGSAISNSISVLVSTYPQAIITASGPTSFCTPGSVTLNANTGTGLSYQWKQNGADIPGATAASLIVSSTGSYECLVTNYCGSTISNTISVTTGILPATPGSIIGQTTGVCASTLSYAISPVSGATGYIWTVPSGANINSGQGTITINVTFTNIFSGGNISVEATSACGNTGASVSAVSGVPAQPGSINGLTSVCHNQNNVIYNIAAVTSATSYTWTVPPGTQIKNGQGTIQIRVRFGNSAGNITVVANNACGSGPVRTLTIAMPCREEENISSGDFAVNVFPNPSNNDFTFIITASENNFCSINIFDLTGRIVESHQNIPANKEFKCGSELKDGIYFAEIISGESKKVLKLIMQR